MPAEEGEMGEKNFGKGRRLPLNYQFRCQLNTTVNVTVFPLNATVFILSLFKYGAGLFFFSM